MAIDRCSAATVEINDGKAVTTSLKVAEVFGKQHKNVIQSIESVQVPAEWRKLNFQPTQKLPSSLDWEFRDTLAHMLPVQPVQSVQFPRKDQPGRIKTSATCHKFNGNTAQIAKASSFGKSSTQNTITARTAPKRK